MKKTILPNSMLAILLLILIVPVRLSAAGVDIEQLLKDVKVCPHAEYIEDSAGTLTLEQIMSRDMSGKWQKKDKKTLGFGFTKSIYWVRLAIANPGDFDRDILIQQEYPLIDSMEMWVYRDAGLREHHVTGRVLPFDNRPYENRTFVFPVKIKAGEILRYISAIKARAQ